MTTSKSRIPAIPVDQLSPAQHGLIGAWTALNYSRVVVKHPEIYATYIPFLEQLVARSALTPRDRELVVLRTLAMCNEEYELDHHKTISRNAALSDEEIVAACEGRGACLSVRDLTVLNGVQELLEQKCLSDDGWASLSKILSEKQLMDFVFLTGCYVMMAMTTRSFGVEIESAEVQNNINSVRDYT